MKGLLFLSVFSLSPFFFFQRAMSGAHHKRIIGDGAYTGNLLPVRWCVLFSFSFRATSDCWFKLGFKWRFPSRVLASGISM
ncbi:hypothetical protein POX_h09860 [Penicillium oxalicum]|uniref:Secreted protein n=1 Tax=Penicillium oxalicum (strain 114-2 / CGMCC 5302) TaxID=933388 RepID=S8AYT8_PENO1|nr:hypothetical protein POX_h09860 [Penicillium oxalicum]EPS31583.1 hypothetical protein PDE_06538 [Penicillium oxalicum 114-2]KAI2786093.1 hypothetical protein POX_h09860 [Penicillium oxalicum]